MELKINIVEASSRSQPDGEAKTWSGMEAVHHADARPWIGPEIRLSKHFERFADLVRETRGFKPFAKVDAGKTATNRRIRQLMELSGQMPLTDSLFDEISTNCNPDNFRHATTLVIVLVVRFFLHFSRYLQPEEGG